MSEPKKIILSDVKGSFVSCQRTTRKRPPIPVLWIWPIVLSFLDYWEHVPILSSQPFQSWFTAGELEAMRKLWVKSLTKSETDTCPFSSVTRMTVCGRLHCETGPAIVWSDGEKHWYWGGKKHRVGGPSSTYKSGGTEWRCMGKLHRVDGPAMEGVGGFCMWFLHGSMHRIGGPAAEYVNGDREWWENGKQIRIEKR